MGLEARCTLRLARQTFAGRAHLETDKLTFRGEAKLDLLLNEVKSAEVGSAGRLIVTYASGVVTLDLADRAMAEQWAQKIRHPKSLIDKLGVRADSRVVVLGVSDEEFARQLRERLATPLNKLPQPALDFIFYAADSGAELAKLKELKQSLQPAGAIWVVSRKGPAATVKDTDVMRAARTAGLVDNKVCGFSATHPALKLVIPRAER